MNIASCHKKTKIFFKCTPTLLHICCRRLMQNEVRQKTTLQKLKFKDIDQGSQVQILVFFGKTLKIQILDSQQKIVAFQSK